MKSGYVVAFLLITAICLIRLYSVHSEPFADVDLNDLQDPAALMKRMRGLLDKYDKPEIWNHAAQMMDKDPGTLARIQLGLHN
jgi:hypothetical protein